eukprot:767743-Hanusia_phi.AAC.9
MPDGCDGGQGACRWEGAREGGTEAGSEDALSCLPQSVEADYPLSDMPETGCHGRARGTAPCAATHAEESRGRHLGEEDVSMADISCSDEESVRKMDMSSDDDLALLEDEEFWCSRCTCAPKFKEPISDVLKKSHYQRAVLASIFGLEEDADGGREGLSLDISEYAEKLRPVQRIDLGCANYMAEGMMYIRDLFPYMPALVHLDVRGNKIGPDGCRHLSDILRHLVNLEFLSIFNNQVCDAGLMLLTDALHNVKSLKTLELGGNNIRSCGAERLGEYLTHKPTLVSLEMGCNHVGNEGATSLGRALALNTCLQHLRICNNNIGSEGSVFLAQCIRNTPHLEALYLGFNEIGDEGAEHIARSFVCVPGLKHIDLYNNGIGQRGVTHIARHLTHLRRLEQLRLDVGPSLVDWLQMPCPPPRLEGLTWAALRVELEVRRGGAVGRVRESVDQVLEERRTCFLLGIFGRSTRSCLRALELELDLIRMIWEASECSSSCTAASLP